MVSRVWFFVFSCVILPYLSAKPVSLNKLIEAEEALSESRPSKPEFAAQQIKLDKLIETEETRKQLRRQKLIQPKGTQEKTTKLRTGVLTSGLSKITKSVSGTVFPQNRSVSPLYYRKTFEIKSPIKPKRVTLFQRSNRLRNQSSKRDTHQYGAVNQKYVPLLRNLGVLFDNILDGADSGETEYGDEYSDESEERVCTCVSKKTGRESRQAAAPSTRVNVTEAAPITQAPAAPTSTAAPHNVSTLGRDQNVSVLFTRNTTGVWRNNIGVDARSGPAHLGSAERHISGDSGDDERHPGDGETETDPEDHKEDTDGHTGDDAGDDREDGLIRRGNPGGFIGKSIVSHKFKTSPNKTAEGLGGLVPEYEGEIQFEIRTDKAKSSRVLSKPDPGLRDATEETQSTDKKDVVQSSNSSNQQLLVGNGEDTQENQELRGTYEGMSGVDMDTSNQNDKYVMIYDGYSVARDVNGKNTLTEKAITIHS